MSISGLEGEIDAFKQQYPNGIEVGGWVNTDTGHISGRRLGFVPGDKIHNGIGGDNTTLKACKGANNGQECPFLEGSLNARDQFVRACGVALGMLNHDFSKTPPEGCPNIGLLLQYSALQKEAVELDYVSPPRV